MNVLSGTLTLPFLVSLDNIRLEVVEDGLPLFHRAQLAVDTTMVSPLKRDGSACRCATVDGIALARARQRKATYPELAGRFGRSSLVVLVCEVGGGQRSARISFENWPRRRFMAFPKPRGVAVESWSCLLA